MVRTLANTKLLNTIASAYVHRGLTPQQAYYTLKDSKFLLIIKGTTYSVYAKAVMSKMYKILQTQPLNSETNNKG